MKRKLVYSRESLDSTTKLLELNPEIHTVWNYRRDILKHILSPEPETKIENNQGSILESTDRGGDDTVIASSDSSIEKHSINKQEMLESELKHNSKMLLKNIKSYWMWNHRLWILESMEEPLWYQELEMINQMFKIDATNFHGWDYRRTVVKKMMDNDENAADGAIGLDGRDGISAEGCKKGSTEHRKSVSVKSEFDYTLKKIKENFSNHSAWHYRSKLLPDVLAELGETEAKQLIEEEVEMIKIAIYSDLDDQNAWLYFDWLQGFTKEKSDHSMYFIGIEMANELLELEPNSKLTFYFYYRRSAVANQI
ncbi:Geranylgeranyl transferase type-2 subunit alpha [Smittium culicis]|uniref:Geranylgeranyl transferase type-2 subunit alpha n=1 Tax=Smittium culicis TaxID=133412 RepID=A0A1R1Y1H8_9FUNG|nr:Geranylgeranyl transferase type-2 subunit alpha [Smittium culicis]